MGLVALEGRDEVGEGLDRDGVAGDGLGEGDVDGVGRGWSFVGVGAVGVEGFQFVAPPREAFEGDLTAAVRAFGIGGVVGEVIGPSAEGVDGGEVVAGLGGEETAQDGEVFLVA